jgi:hypothetical protein
VRGFLLLLTASAVVAGCTFLIPFDDEPRKSEAPSTESPRSSRETTSPKADASTPVTNEPEGGSSEPPVTCPANVGVARCATRTDVFPSYSGSRDGDLVACDGSGHVKQCPGGCMNLAKIADKNATTNFADECDPCSARRDGTYCGRDLGFVTDNADLAIECANGKAVVASDCFKNHCHSVCTRTSPPPLTPSCCQAD